MNRLFWIAALAAWCGFMYLNIDWLWSLQEPLLSFAQAVSVLLFLLFAAGAFLPTEWAGVVQVVVGIFGVLALWGGTLSIL
ncbi:MAG: hypothetical protein LUE89_09480 [Clostridiales bacterium]|nr:hypothetical protein [Clostridiales bacterium]